MLRRHFLLASLAASGCQTTPAGDPAAPSPLAVQIRTYFEPLERSRDLSGAFRIERAGEITEVRFGFADWAARTPLGPQTRFASGSIAKGMIATILLSLAREGAVDMHAAVSTYLPTYRYGADMSVDDVLAHVAGLPRDVSDDDRAGFGADGLVGWLNTRAPTPNGSFQYSNVGYELLALIAERVTGATYSELARTRIFTPLGMTQSSMEDSNFNASGALPHVPGPPPEEIRLARRAHLAPGGQLYASTADLARWGRAVRDQTLIDLHHGDPAAPGGGLAGGVTARDIKGRPVLWMQGSIPGGGAVVVAFKDEDLVIVTAFNMESYPQQNAEEVVTDIVAGVTPSTAPMRLPATQLGDAHRALAGEYELPGLGRVRIDEQNGEMTLTMLGPGYKFYLTPASEGRLVMRAFNFTFAARRDAAGAVNGLRVRLHMLGQPSPGDSEIDKLA